MKTHVDELVSDPDALTWRPARELVRGDRLRCIDGRSPAGAVGAPGGSVGELLLAISIAEWLRGEPYGRPAIERIVDRYAERVGGLYLHTDRHALAALALSLGVSESQAESLLRTPEPAWRERLADAVMEPAHIGCGHLRAVIEEPLAYRVRSRLARELVRAVHRRAWTHGDVTLETLDGDHAESAVLVVHSRCRVDDETLLPTPSSEHRARYFIEHLPALRIVRSRAIAALVDADPVLAQADAELFRLELERLGERHLSLTLGALAPSLPRHRLSIEPGPRVVAAFAGAEP